MCVINHNWSATKQRLHPQSVAEISQLQSAMVDYNWGMNNVALYQKLVNVVNSWSYVTLITWVRFFETLYKCAAYNVLFIQSTLKCPLKCVSFIVIKNESQSQFFQYIESKSNEHIDNHIIHCSTVFCLPYLANSPSRLAQLMLNAT